MPDQAKTSVTFSRNIIASIGVHGAAGSLVLILQWLLTQIMAIENYGAYAYAFSWITVLVLLSNRGIDITSGFNRWVAITGSLFPWNKNVLWILKRSIGLFY